MGREPDTTVDFGKLNAAERTALSLLARGHTAKSIATLTDRSVGAVNERLREARRKTGIGSSRELARMFAAQESRDELIGMAPQPIVNPAPIPPVAQRRPWKGTALMSVTLVGAIGAIALIAQPAPQTALVPATTSSGDAALYSDAPSPRQLHDRMMAEARDPIWAPRTEAALEQWFADQPVIARVARAVKAHCGSSMCEIVGRFDAGAPSKRVNAAMQMMQGKPLVDAIAPMRLKFDSGSFAESGMVLFVTRQPVDGPAQS